MHCNLGDWLPISPRELISRYFHTRRSRNSIAVWAGLIINHGRNVENTDVRYPAIPRFVRWGVRPPIRKHAFMVVSHDFFGVAGASGGGGAITLIVSTGVRKT